MKILTVYDSKAEYFFQPFYAKATNEAIRIFKDMANNPKSAIAHHPEDYSLFEIGEFDEDKGDIVLYESKKSLGLASYFVNKEETTEGK